MLALQVAEALTPAHCLHALQSLADEAREAALPPERLAAALRLAGSVHELQAQGHSFHGQACASCFRLFYSDRMLLFHACETRKGCNCHRRFFHHSLYAPLDPTCPPRVGSFMLTSRPNVQPLGERLLLCPGQVMVPDAEGVMAPARACHFNDAPWLAAESAQRMAHPGLDSEAAEALGCQSLRYHHQVCACSALMCSCCANLCSLNMHVACHCNTMPQLHEGLADCAISAEDCDCMGMQCVSAQI